jgi:protein-tyrosine-phosphatase
VHAELGAKPDGGGALEGARRGPLRDPQRRVQVDDEIHPYAVQAMQEIGIDTSDQYPKGLRTYMGKMHFGYLIIVCARAEQDCPTIFPGVGHQFSWLFDDPGSPDVPEEERLTKFREVRDQIEAKILDWLERPQDEIEKLKAQRIASRRNA